jgi:hypothetical protein
MLHKESHVEVLRSLLNMQISQEFEEFAENTLRYYSPIDHVTFALNSARII